MRCSLIAFSTLVVGSLSLLGCGGSSLSKNDFSALADLSAARDLSASQPDMKTITPYNMPGMVYCYDSTPCSTSSASPVCCDAPADGGFADTCVASEAACTTASSEAHAYQCGQAADCGAGRVCCGAITVSSSGASHFTGTSCAASCGTGQTQLCVAASDCTISDTSCMGKSVSGRDVGLCQ
jgi:hypothetical protein